MAFPGSRRNLPGPLRCSLGARLGLRRTGRPFFRDALSALRALRFLRRALSALRVRSRLAGLITGVSYVSEGSLALQVPQVVRVTFPPVIAAGRFPRLSRMRPVAAVVSLIGELSVVCVVRVARVVRVVGVVMVRDGGHRSPLLL
ncbi:hypothetical protein RKD18_003232 [Streptomyces phaeoluteigriseus]